MPKLPTTSPSRCSGPLLFSAFPDLSFIYIASLPITAAPDELVATTDNAKYQRSALGETQAQRIAAKVQQAVHSGQLYLDPALTLYKLAEHIGVSAQYLSQTLNQTLQQSFYDYINEARIAAAMQQLQQTDDSVLTIAMAVGFNARSSFYKAFKNCTGLTPAEYRAQRSMPGRAR
ncbi:helix-turn-helix domain-containing protein [Rheinheimera maricola]|uniref:Helix-turn-helix transcriptional regulator n=1 Tax=Rheinheimera maricola TaxID=2793282 RepID=A0ABS7XD45_9GAMM|nr:helix-turn-helix transcriptional regulator [Rheinheimera maricola]MBZ9613474.1 helix-turn-helix transcriptional regulator [Rheinheimera maricola]